MNTMVKTCWLLLALLPAASQAARPWLLPSQTVLARSGGWVAVDAAQADDLFSVNQAALPIDSLSVTGPDGLRVAPQNPHQGRSRASFDLELRQPGTYRIAVADDLVMARWQEDGKPKRWRGKPAKMAANVPADAAGVDRELMQRRVETFVTVGSPTEVRHVSGAGLELVPLRHPNDLYAGEVAKFRVLLDGKAAQDLQVEIIAAGTRYRDTPEALVPRTDVDGEFSVTWPAPGLYWLAASLSDERANMPGVKTRRASYHATFEVLPQ